MQKNRLTIHLREYYRKNGNQGYILICDIHNFFGSTDHALAIQAMYKVISDEWARMQIAKIINSFEGDAGIGLGSQVSQLIELLYLNDLDHFIKERLHVKYYVRYMDDFILIDKDKETLQKDLIQIEEKLTNIKLELNKKKTQIRPLSEGIKFLGFKFRLTDTGRVLVNILNKKIFHEKRKLRKQHELYLTKTCKNSPTSEVVR